jgi:dienelactone hydrolase
VPCGSQSQRARAAARAFRIALAGVFALAGCARGGIPFGALASRDDSMPEFTSREASLLGGFLTVELMIPTSPAGPRPAIISPTLDRALLLERGFALVRYTAHWEMLRGLEPRPASESSVRSDADAAAETQVGTWLLAAPRPGIVGRAYLTFIGADARNHVPLVVDLLETFPEIDAERIAVAGSSTAGFTALEALAAEPRLAAGVVRVACGDYHEFLKNSSLALDGDERWLIDGQMVLDEDYDAELREREPIRSAERFPPRPLLMLNGAQDPAIPLVCARPTAAALERAYAARGLSERFRFVLYPERGHDLGAPARDETLHWWERWLLGSELERAGSSER